MRRFCLLLAVLCPLTAAAQQADRKAVLITAQHANWHVRVTLPADTVQGVVRSVFRDSARIETRRIFIPAIQSIERRIAGGAWTTVWPIIPSVESDTAAGLPGSAFVYAATGALVYPAIFFFLPPPLILGVQIGRRSGNWESTAGARGLAYPGALSVLALDIGRNHIGRDGRSYSGFAAGFLFGRGEGRIVPVGSIRLGAQPRNSGARVELRGDVIISNGVGGFVSVSAGMDTRSR